MHNPLHQGDRAPLPRVTRLVKQQQQYLRGLGAPHDLINEDTIKLLHAYGWRKRDFMQETARLARQRKALHKLCPGCRQHNVYRFKR
jgi:hypothetical protein